MLSIVFANNNLLLKSTGLGFESDRDKLLALPYKKPVYADDKFRGWEISSSSLPAILSMFKPGEIVSSGKAKELIDDFNFNLIPIAELPREAVTVESADGKVMRDYQEDFVALTHKKKRILLAYSMRVGKSLASLLRAKQTGGKKILIVCPAGVISNWNTEIKKTYGSESNITIYKGTKPKRSKIFVNEVGLYITNYEMLGEFLLKCDPDSIDQLIFDEIHKVSNPQTAIYKAARKAIKDNPNAFVQGLSGTPLRLKLKDLWGVLSIIYPEVVGSQSYFLSRFEEVLWSIRKKIKGKWVNIPVKTRTKNQPELQKLLSALMIRVRREDFVDINDKIELFTTELTDKQRSYYKKAKEQILLELDDRTLELKNVMTRMLRLLQISEALFNIDEKLEDSAKFDHVVNEIEETEEPIIIWSRFKKITYRLYEKFKDQAVLYNGDQNDSQKKLAVWAFQGCSPGDLDEYYKIRKRYPEFTFEPGQARVFISTYNLNSGLGIDLSKAKYQIFTSLDFNPASLFQAKDRFINVNDANRDLLTRILVSEDTIEREVYQNILNNYKNASNIIDKGTGIGYTQVQELLRILRN